MGKERAMSRVGCSTTIHPTESEQDTEDARRPGTLLPIVTS